MKQHPAIFLFSLVLAVPALGASVDDGARDVIVVTATRSETALEDVIVPVTVINREQIELAAAGDVAELLRFEAGLDIGRNGGAGQAASVFLRGTESNHTLVLIDGVRINPGTIGGAALQNIAPEVIERIEIVKGSRSSLYGTDAIGGVINIITRRAERSYAETGLGGGSFGTGSAYASAGLSGDAYELGATVNFLDTDGYAVRTDSDVERGYDNLSLNLDGSRTLGESTVGFRLWRAEGTTEYLDFFLAPVSQDYRNQMSAVEFDTPLGRGSSRLLVSHMIDEIAQNDSEDFVRSTRLAVDWQYSLPVEHHALAVGLYATGENAESLAFGSGFDEDTDTRALFVQDSIEYGRHRAFLALRHTDHETFGDELTWNAEYALDLTEAVTVGAGAGRAFRAPDATDRFGFGGNVELRAESSDELQLHAEWRIDERQSASLEFYRNDIDDLIEFDNATFTLENIAEAEIRGAEIGWSYRGDAFGLQADAVFQQAENAADSSRLLRRAERSLAIRATRRLGDHLLGLSVLASGDRVDVADATLPGYVLMNLTGQFRLGSSWQLNARIENLLDTDYQTAAPYRMAGRSAYLEAKYLWH